MDIYDLWLASSILPRFCLVTSENSRWFPHVNKIRCLCHLTSQRTVASTQKTFIFITWILKILFRLSVECHFVFLPATVLGTYRFDSYFSHFVMLLHRSTVVCFSHNSVTIWEICTVYTAKTNNLVNNYSESVPTSQRSYSSITKTK